MSLIKGSNFLAPFTNRTHLFSIIVLTLLFAVYRWAGGSVTVERAPFEGLRREREAAPAAEQRRAPAEQPKRLAPADPAEDDLLKSLLRGTETKERNKAEQPETKGNLDDIKRQLGLE